MIDRRAFLAGSATLGLNAMTAAQPPRTLRVGLIGCGWYGMVSLRHLLALNGGEVVSLCDVDSKHLDEAATEVAGKQKGKPATFGDYREMLKPKNLDIVLVATPDHWHALAAIAAMEAGADVYVEKPISHTYFEGRAMVNTARKLKRVVQVNTQRRSTPHIVKAREFLKAGNLGTIGEVKAFCYYNMRGEAAPADTPAPPTLNYEMWTGPAPMRPFNSLMHPKGWRKFNAYSNGILGDMGVHMLDVMRWCMGVGTPKSVHSTGGIFVQKAGKADITDTQTVAYDYGHFTATWEHRTYGRSEDVKYPWGVRFLGDKGTLTITLDGWDFEPWNSKAKAVEEKVIAIDDPAKKEDPKVVSAGRAHMKNFLECVATREKPIADIEEGHFSTTLCTLGTISQTLGRAVRWDQEKELCVGDEEAQKLLRRPYRGPWVYPTG